MKLSADIPVHELPDLHFQASSNGLAFGEHRPSHRINFFALIWFCETKGQHFIDFEPLPVEKDKIYLIGSSQIHSIPSDDLPKANTIVFSNSFFELIEEPHLRQLFLPFNNQGIQIPAEMVASLKALFDLIKLESEGEADPVLLLKYFTAFMMHLHRFSHQSQSDGVVDDKRILRLFQLLSLFYKEKRDVGFYAAEVGLTGKRINEILRKKMGTTVSQLIYHLLLIEAKRALFHNQLSVKEIAYDLGFSEQSYFARFFKKYTGLSPEQFRSQAEDHTLLDTPGKKMFK